MLSLTINGLVYITTPLILMFIKEWNMSVSAKIFRKWWRTGVAKEKEERDNGIHTGPDLEHLQKPL